MPDMPTAELEQPDIRLVGPFVAHDATSTPVRVDGISIEAVGYCCDVYVDVLDGSYELSKDENFLAAVNAKLREAGYVGPDLGRASMGLQLDSRITLESTREFENFAVERGWNYADGNDALAVNRLLQAIPWNAVVAFRASNGVVYGVPVGCIVEHHAAAHVAQYESMAQSLEQFTLPLFRADHAALVKWLQNHMTWADFGTRVRVMEEPPKIDVQAEYAAAKHKAVRGMSRVG